MSTTIPESSMPQTAGGFENPSEPLVDPIESQSESRFARALNFARGAGKAALIAFELLPITNEGSRYGALAYAETQTQNPLVGAAVLGGATLLVEGAGALASAKWISENRVVHGLEAASEKLDHTRFARVNLIKPLLKLSDRLSRLDRISPPVEAGMAMTLGTVATLEARQRVDPDRTTAENIRHGLFTAGWMSSVFAAEGALISEGIGNYTDPTAVGASVLGFASIMGAAHWAKKRFSTAEAESNSAFEVTSSSRMTEAEIQQTILNYENYHKDVDGPILTGLFGVDLDRSLRDPETIVLKDDAKYSPLLVPVEDLDWYNLPFLKEKYNNAPLYCYVHPEIPDSEEARSKVADAIEEVLNNGGVILYDQYKDVSPLAMDQWNHENSEIGGNDSLTRGDNRYEVEALGHRSLPKKDDIFIGRVTVNQGEVADTELSMYEAYVKGVESGALVVDVENGPSLENVMSEEDADKVWQIYKRPFERLSKGHPVLAGFDEMTLKGILRDPEVIKAVNRADGDITTVSIFTQDFAHCPWFNDRYYEQNYPQDYNSNNILLCPGIVSDEERRGHTFSWSLVDLMVKTIALQKKDVLLSFECTEISTRYIPQKVVARGVEASGIATAEGFDAPVSTIVYKALQKASN